MSLRNEESPWAILDPALKKPKFFEENSEQAKQNTYLDYTLPLPETNKIKKAIDKKKESDLVPTLFEEIENELMHHRYDIYIEKLNTFKKQLISIEKETHKEIIKSDKKALAKVQEDLSQIEAFYQYQLDALERDIATEKSNILHEHKKSLELTRKIIALEKNNISNQPSIKKKRRRSESEEGKTIYKERTLIFFIKNEKENGIFNKKSAKCRPNLVNQRNLKGLDQKIL
ncbi:uncharacterized protein B0P05DRAFT_551322 [Gilbertella persicaria]|uniref:uncharacterized protein n=1 Tax=Gilbertella persicaria TaxID=101096 RepID=UPI00221F5FAB|nr:uncharacterized protein B0P05DRAFT_551322 [Gilbertella persicaria]KAI8069042.1 hypothetical protein B0P05DRAFT_551322 [Gilbertella persicaria]